MTPQQSLKYHLALLLATHGEKAVLTALADTIKLSQDELERLLIELKELGPRNRRKTTGTKQDVVELLVTQHPDKAEVLRALSARYRNKTFLPELRDVRRFFEQHSRSIGQTKSRSDALPKLARLLVDLDLGELKALCALPESNEYSSLGVISDQILGREQK